MFISLDFLRGFASGKLVRHEGAWSNKRAQLHER